MQTLDFSHNYYLVAMSCLVAVVAGFTGLSLTRNLSAKTVAQKKISVALAAVALGGGIWSMHFVAMLGLQLPILFYYDAAITLVSALTAILVLGAALILLHFTERTRTVIVAAGAIVGIGILLMHYIGMAGLELCRAVYSPVGMILSSAAAIVLCILAFGVAYGQRSNRNILLGTLCFATAVCSVHFLAMAGTDFVTVSQLVEFGPTMGNEVLALGVILSSFVIFGAFLWVGITYLLPGIAPPSEEQPDEPEDTDVADVPEEAVVAFQIPCERDGGKVFVSPQDVAFVRADGHYTQVYTDKDRLFCVWPITVATKRLSPAGFLKTHRSYLINPSKVARFERSKDKGSCTFEGKDVPPAPVSRSQLRSIQDAMVAQGGATHAS